MDEIFYYESDDAPFPNVPLTPGVAAILFDDKERILIIKRTKGPYWSLPGGRMDIGESAPECCIRETEEETGLKTRVVRLIGLYTNSRSICAYPDGNVHQSYIALFECIIIGGCLQVSEETTRFHWLDKKDMNNFLLLPDNVLCCKDAWSHQVAAYIR